MALFKKKTNENEEQAAESETAPNETKKKIKSIIWISVAVVCIAVFIFSGWHFYTRWQARNTQNLIQEIGLSQVQATPNPTPQPQPIEPIHDEPESELEPYEQESETPQRPTKPRRPNEREINFEELRELNPNVIGWIEIPGTRINYPIVSTTDNEFYVHHDLLGNRSHFGTLFTDFINNSWDDSFVIIYGHNMNDGSKFAGLHNFRDLRFFNRNRMIHIYTPEGQLDFRIFAAYDWSDENLIIGNNLWTRGSLRAYLEEIRWGDRPQRGNVDLDDMENITEFDSFLTLSTCTARATDRYLVKAVFVYPE